MHLIRTFVLLLIIGALFISCSSNSSNPIATNDDTTPPSTITDLVATNPTGTSVTLFLTAPGDDGLIGRAREYDVRYSTSNITAANFDSASQFTSANQPNVGTADDTIIVTGLLSNTKYYFAVKAGDEVPNWGEISNVVSATTQLAGSWTVYDTYNSDLPNDTVLDVDFDGGIKYFATNAGLAKYDNSSWEVFDESYQMTIDTIIDTMTNDTVYDTTRYIPSNYLSSVSVAQDGTVWMGSNGHGIAKLVDSTATRYGSDNSGLTSNGVTDVLAVSDGVWVGTFNDGLFKFDNVSTWTNYSTNEGLSYKGIDAISENDNGDIWIGLNIFGGSKFDGAVFTNYGSGDGFTNQAVWDVDAVALDMIVFGTDDGAYIYNGSTWTPYFATDSGLVDNVVTSVAVDNNGTIWFGTRFGLTSLNGTTWTTYTIANSDIPDNFINALKVDMFGNLWVCTNNGVAAFQSN